jgi:hypothetical protein
VNFIPLSIPDLTLKAPMAIAKDNISHKSLSSYFAYFVRHIHCFHSHIDVTCSDDRLWYIREYHVA